MFIDAYVLPPSREYHFWFTTERFPIFPQFACGIKYQGNKIETVNSYECFNIGIFRYKFNLLQRTAQRVRSIIR